MKDLLQFDFIVDKDNNTITIRREFNANLQLLWDAWTKAELLDQWWAPQPWKSVTKRMNFVEGGERLYAMVGPEGEEHWGLTKYESIVELTNFNGSDYFTDNEGAINENMPGSHFKLYFSEKGERTLTENISTYSSLEQLEAVISMGFKEGMTIALEGLDKVLAKLQA